MKKNIIKCLALALCMSSSGLSLFMSIKYNPHDRNSAQAIKSALQDVNLTAGSIR